MRKQNYRKKSSRRPRTRGAIIRTALGKSWKKSVAKVCKRVISKQAEVKEQTWTTTTTPGNTLQSPSTMVGKNVFPLSPFTAFLTVNQGNGQSNRVGNVIQLKSLTGKIVLYPKPYDIANNPSDSNRPAIVTFWCVTPKQKYFTPTDMASAFDTTFFDNGNSSQGYTSSLLDLVLPFNEDKFSLHFKRSYKLGHSGPTDNGVPTDAINEYWSNNDYKMNHIINFNFTKFMPKRITFDDTTSDATCRTVYLIVGIAKADGTAYSGSSYYPVDMYMNLNLKYTDM